MYRRELLRNCQISATGFDYAKQPDNEVHCNIRTACVYGYKRSESQFMASGRGMENEKLSKIGRQNRSKGDISGGPCARRASVSIAC